MEYALRFCDLNILKGGYTQIYRELCHLRSHVTFRHNCTEVIHRKVSRCVYICFTFVGRFITTAHGEEDTVDLAQRAQVHVGPLVDVLAFFCQVNINRTYFGTFFHTMDGEFEPIVLSEFLREIITVTHRGNSIGGVIYKETRNNSGHKFQGIYTGEIHTPYGEVIAFVCTPRCRTIGMRIIGVLIGVVTRYHEIIVKRCVYTYFFVGKKLVGVIITIPIGKSGYCRRFTVPVGRFFGSLDTIPRVQIVLKVRYGQFVCEHRGAHECNRS